MPDRVSTLQEMVGKTIAAVVGNGPDDYGDEHHGCLIAFTDGSFASGSISVNDLSQLGETERLVAAGLLTTEDAAAITLAEEQQRLFALGIRERDELRRLLVKYGVPDDPHDIFAATNS
jgi:hypothetical protein